MDRRTALKTVGGAVAAAAAPWGLVLAERVPMPANNQMLVFRRSGADRDASMRPE